MLKKIEQLFLNFGVKLKSIKELSNTILIEDYNDNSILLDFHSFNAINQVFKYKSNNHNFIFINKLNNSIFEKMNDTGITDFELKYAFNTHLYINIDNEEASFIFSFHKLNRVQVPLNFISKKMNSLEFEVIFNGKEIKYKYLNQNFNNFAGIIVESYKIQIEEKLPNYNINIFPEETLKVLKLMTY